MTNEQPPGGQPWPRQAQPYRPEPQYSPAGHQPPSRRRKSWPARRKILTAFAAIGASFIAVIAVASAGNGDHTVATGGTSAAPTGAASPSKAAAPKGSARVGSTITLTGNTSGEQIAVTVTRVSRHAQPATDMDAPASGKRLYAVQFRLNDTGSAAYSDSPSNGAVVVDAAGQSYQSSLSDAAGCDSFTGTENIAAGQSGIGCIVFEVPSSAIITGVQFTLDSGMGPQTGQWDVRR
jgi:Domain of unknown function (DUF4352)